MSTAQEIVTPAQSFVILYENGHYTELGALPIPKAGILQYLMECSTDGMQYRFTNGPNTMHDNLPIMYVAKF